MAEITITRDNFDSEVMHSDVPVLLDFWATWCGPCRMLAPVLEQVDAQKAGTVKIGKINVDEEPDLAASFGIASIPTLVVVKNGQIVNQAVGYRDLEGVNALL